MGEMGVEIACASRASVTATKDFSLHQMRARKVDDLGQIVADRSGRFLLAPSDWANQTDAHGIKPDEIDQLRHWGLGSYRTDRLERLSNTARTLARQAGPAALDYLILVPTLRCDLACDYCQVSRVQAQAKGFDWTEETLVGVERLIEGIEGDQIKIEFQGGEPTLRLDILERIIARCERFAHRSFVICTNLSNLSPRLLALLDRDDTTVSTSLDGPSPVHQAQRTHSDQATDRFFANLEQLISRYGPEKVSALPTIDQQNPPDPDDLIAAFARYGLTSIYLRPINFQGFARKRHKAARDSHDDWWAYHQQFVLRLIARNAQDRSTVLEESYFSLCLRRIFRVGLDRHVDLRNPNPMGTDYFVIDYDGAFYPTDEARMLHRSRIVDLSIGNIATGMDVERRDLLNTHTTMNGDPDCERCPYQPFCGRDVVDDLSRYGRIDLPKPDTFFCRRHTAIFDLAMRLIYSDDPATQYSLAKWLGLSGDRLPKLPRL